MPQTTAIQISSSPFYIYFFPNVTKQNLFKQNNGTFQSDTERKENLGKYYLSNMYQELQHVILKKKNVPALSRNKYPTFFPFFENTVKGSESCSVVSDSQRPHVGMGGLSLLQSDLGIEPGSPALQADSLPTELSREAFLRCKKFAQGLIDTQYQD